MSPELAGLAELLLKKPFCVPTEMTSSESVVCEAARAAMPERSIRFIIWIYFGYAALPWYAARVQLDDSTF